MERERERECVCVCDICYHIVYYVPQAIRLGRQTESRPWIYPVTTVQLLWLWVTTKTTVPYVQVRFLSQFFWKYICWIDGNETCWEICSKHESFEWQMPYNYNKLFSCSFVFFIKVISSVKSKSTCKTSHYLLLKHFKDNYFF